MTKIFSTHDFHHLQNHYFIKFFIRIMHFGLFIKLDFSILCWKKLVVLGLWQKNGRFWDILVWWEGFQDYWFVWHLAFDFFWILDSFGIWLGIGAECFLIRLAFGLAFGISDYSSFFSDAKYSDQHSIDIITKVIYMDSLAGNVASAGGSKKGFFKTLL